MRTCDQELPPHSRSWNVKQPMTELHKKDCVVRVATSTVSHLSRNARNKRSCGYPAVITVLIMYTLFLYKICRRRMKSNKSAVCFVPRMMNHLPSICTYRIMFPSLAT